MNELYRKSRAHFGFLNWWPGETSFEVIVGAVLTQQTSWSNVKKAISNLKQNNSLTLEAVSDMGTNRLEALVRPSGYFRQKAQRLKSLCVFIKKNYGSVESFLSLDSKSLRDTLLSQNGIGKETCDSIMLYAAGKQVFVIDAYTKRICARVFGISEKIGYDELQLTLQNCSGNDIALMKDMHAQFVEIGKNYCKKGVPLCEKCPLNKMCGYSISKSLD